MITNGMTVTVNYTGKLKQTGEVFDTTDGSEPLSFRMGVDNVVSGFQKAILGRQIGDRFTVDIPREEAYGDYMDEKIKSIPKGYMPGEVEPDQILIARGASGDEARVLVKEVNEEFVVIDGNHPLAGLDLVFDIEVIDAI